MDNNWLHIGFWLGLLVVAVVVVSVILRALHRFISGSDPRSHDLDMADLEKLLASGRMTQEEYLKARAVILSRTDASFEPAKGFPVLAPQERKKTPPTTWFGRAKGFPVLPKEPGKEPPDS